MENLISLEYHGTPVRCIQKEGAPWWVLSDVCKVLSIGNPRNVATRLDEDEKNTVHLTDGIRGNPNFTIINESGLYSVLLRSDKPEAKPFKRWVTHEVLPQIRRTGRYEPKPEPEPEQPALPIGADGLVDIVEIEERTGVTREEVRSCMRMAGNLVYGDDYMVLRNEALMMYKRQRRDLSRKTNALTVFTQSGLEKLKPYLQIPERKPEPPEPQALPFDEMMKLRYNRITQAQMLLHIADRTPDANQRNYLYEYITDILMEEDVWKEGDNGFKGRSADFWCYGVEGNNKRCNLESACALAQRGEPVEHDAVIAEVHRPKTLSALMEATRKKGIEEKEAKA